MDVQFVEFLNKFSMWHGIKCFFEVNKYRTNFTACFQLFKNSHVVASSAVTVLFPD